MEKELVLISFQLFLHMLTMKEETASEEKVKRKTGWTSAEQENL